MDTFPDGRQVIYCFRKQGQKFGGHYHKGDDPNRHPEILLLVTGKIRWETEDLHGRKMSTVVDASQGVPQKITVPRYMWHNGEALTNCMYVEVRDRPFDPHKSDTFDREDFEKIKNE